MMKKHFKWSSIFGLICIFVSILTVNSYAESNEYLKDSVTLKAGIYYPTGDLDDYDVNFNGEIAFNKYFSPNFATEFSLGYFKTSNSEWHYMMDA